MILRHNRKFRPPEEFSPASKDYHLLPFRFHVLDEQREVLVNELGDYLLVPRGTAGRIARHELEQGEKIFEDLLANFFISNTLLPELTDVIATRYRTKKSAAETAASLQIIVPTLRCNHTCQYCQVSRQTEDKSGFDITFENLDRALDLIFQNPASHITIEFQGGEPLLAFDRVTYGVLGAEARNQKARKSLTFVLCTNLTVLSGEILDFCRAHRIQISTSLDGPEFIHNTNRKQSRSDSYENVIKGIARTRAVLGHDRVSALMTTTRLSLQHPIEIIDCYVENGFDTIFLRELSPFGFAARGKGRVAQTTNDFIQFYKTGLDYILELNAQGIKMSEVFASIILKKILTPFDDGYVDLQSPAGLINSVAVFNYDGGVYASDESRMLAEVGETQFRLGSVNDTYEDLFLGAVAQGISRHWVNESLAGCADCGLQAYCGADPVRNYATQRDMAGYRPTSDYCAKNMAVIEFLFSRLATDKNAERTFRSWVT